MTDEQTTIQELQHKIEWLEQRYKQINKIIADSVAATLPLELQQNLYLDIYRRTKLIQEGEITLYQKPKRLRK